MAVNQSLTLLQVSQNIAENTSQVRLLWQSTQTGDSYNAYLCPAKFWVRVNSGAWQEYVADCTLPKNQTVTVADQTITVSHSTDGNCLVQVITSMTTGVSAGVVELQEQLQLTQIPRHSQITATDAFIGGICTVRIQKANAAYKHSLCYSLTGAAPWTYLDENGNISSNEVIFSRDTVEFLLPESFYDKIPNGRSGQCTLQCKTWYSDTQSLTGSTATTFTYTADPARCAPLVICSLADTNSKILAITGKPTTLVRYMSNVQVDVTPQPRCGATIVDPQKNVAVWNTGTWYYGTRVEIPNVETDLFKTYARDSRGYETYGEKFAEEFINYVRLTNQTTAQRLTPTGSSVKLTVSGSCYKGGFGGIYNVQNIVQVWYRIATTQAGLQAAPWYEFQATLGDNTYIATIQLEDIPYDDIRWVETWSQDRLQYVTKVVKIGRGVPVFDWGETDFCFHVPVEVPALKVNGQTLDAYIRNVIQGGEG